MVLVWVTIMMVVVSTEHDDYTYVYNSMYAFIQQFVLESK